MKFAYEALPDRHHIANRRQVRDVAGLGEVCEAKAAVLERQGDLLSKPALNRQVNFEQS